MAKVLVGLVVIGEGAGYEPSPRLPGACKQLGGLRGPLVPGLYSGSYAWAVVVEGVLEILLECFERLCGGCPPRYTECDKEARRIEFIECEAFAGRRRVDG